LVTGQKSIMQTPNSAKVASPQPKMNTSKLPKTESPDNVNKPAPTAKTLPFGTGSAELRNDEIMEQINSTVKREWEDLVLHVMFVGSIFIDCGMNPMIQIQFEIKSEYFDEKSITKNEESLTKDKNLIPFLLVIELAVKLQSFKIGHMQITFQRHLTRLQQYVKGWGNNKILTEN
ncbi:hypothetical protein T11_8111, partial [Trichinella zimbabwensis]